MIQKSSRFRVLNCCSNDLNFLRNFDDDFTHKFCFITKVWEKKIQRAAYRVGLDNIKIQDLILI